jgi:tetratricopeptide (TPR) repeat protein
MNMMRKSFLWAVLLPLCALLARAQAPLAQPLANFDKLVSQLKVGSVVGEPIRVGDTAVIPFAMIKFGLGGGGAMIGFGGGMDGKTVPLGILVVEGDDVRAELFPEQEQKPAFLQEIVQAIRDRKVVIMGNGLNIGHVSGTAQDLAPLVAAMMGQTTVMGNALNLGHVSAPSVANASPGELKKLFDAKKYADALAMADALIAKDSKNADLHVWKGRILGAQGNLDGAIVDFETAAGKKPSPETYYYLGEAFKNKGLNGKAAAAYRKALELRPNYPEASKALATIK